MDITVFTELEFFFRILIAGICGGLIGYERNNRLKEAGIRTHLIVALAAALIMVVSKYGFSDVTTSTKTLHGSTSPWPSRSRWKSRIRGTVSPPSGTSS